MKVNDAHCHFGRESFFGSIARLKLWSGNDYDSLRKSWDTYDIQNAVLFPQPCPASMIRYLSEGALFLLGYCFFKTIDETTFKNVNYTLANEEISRLNDDRIEFVPFVSSGFKISDIERFDNISGVKFYEPYGAIPDILLNYLNENELGMVLHLSEDSGKSPARFLKAVENNDGINFQVAHCANGSREVIDALDEYSNLFVDTAACTHRQYNHIPLKNIIQEHPGKVLFGSDEPWTKYDKQIARILELDLTKNETEKVLSQNYLKVWG